MKKYHKNVLLIVLVLVMIIIVFYTFKKQDTEPKYSIDHQISCNIDHNLTSKKIESINNNVKNYTSDVKDILEKSSEGGEQTNYSFDDKVTLIKQTLYGESGRSEISYYLENNKVFYFRKTNYLYQQPLSIDSSGTLKNTEVNEFYLDSNQDLCSWYSNNKIQENTDASKGTVQFLLSDLF